MTENLDYQYSDDLYTSSHGHILPLLEEILVKIKKNFNKNPLVLDMGCGNGAFCNILYSLGFEVAGLDHSKSGIEIAKKSFPNITFFNSDIYDFKEPDLYAKYNIVTSIEVIEHLIYPRELLRQAKKYLSPNGYLLLSTPYHGYLKNFILGALNLWDNHFCVGWDIGHIKFFSVKSLKDLLNEEGFTNLNFYFSGGFPYIWKNMICLCQAPRPSL